MKAETNNWKTRRGVCTIRCDSLAHFHLIHATHFRQQRNLIFRGHGSITWRTESSLVRAIKKQCAGKTGYAADARFMAQAQLPLALSEFLQRLDSIGDHEMRMSIREYYDAWSKVARAEVDEVNQALSRMQPYRISPERLRLRQLEVQLLSIAQHYGMPTPLVDWSRSPYVAWYFALSEDQVYYPTVLAISPSVVESVAQRWLNGRLDELRGSAKKQLAELRRAHPDAEVTLEDIVGSFDIADLLSIAEFSHSPVLSHFNERQPAQQGTLTKHSLQRTLEKILEIISSEVTRPLLYKFVLVGEKREEAMVDLRLMDVTGQTLFPGLTGAARLGADSVRFEGYSALYGYPHPFGSA